MNSPNIQEISIELLREHPENSNFMNKETSIKLKRHIELTGRYEPLTVRPHPIEEGKYQVINGHNRLKVLRSLNYQTVSCVVWRLADDQTRIYLATLNRLSGNDVPERRAVLLDILLHSFDIDELALLLPEDKKQLGELGQLSQLEPDELFARNSSEDKLTASVIMTFMPDEPEAKEVNLAIDLVMKMQTGEQSRSQAIVHLACFYLDHCIHANWC